tara:strand:- start:360 stop:581 length:222 start_codon:yes stop_codon:yes gene_type:complete
MTPKKLSQHDQDFADVIALKLRLNREQREKEKKRQSLIEEYSEFRISIAKNVIQDHPGLSLEEAIEMIKEGGF